MVFDFAAAAFHDLGWRVNAAGTDRAVPRPLKSFGLLIAMSAIGYLPLLLYFGPTRWLAFGPFAVQASRIGLYAVYFFAGVTAGRHGVDRFLVPRDDPSRWRWARWPLLAASLYVCFVGLLISRLSGWLTPPPLAWLSLYGLNLMLFCAAANFAWLATVLRFARRSTRWSDSLAVNSYGIYLLHYAAVTWMQYALLDARLNAILKATLVFAVALPLSWGSTIVLRRIPGATRVI
jgi:peptidoglycan/LPS O-acetylase OafA/YrhL